jgi:hypothetical protein
MVTLGMSAPAFAEATFTLTLKLTNKADSPLTGYDIYPIPLDGTNNDNVAIPQDDPIEPATASATAGEYTMQLFSGFDYTFGFSPNGAAANSGTFQYLGGTAYLAGASHFTANSANTFMAVSIATGATITGKVTGPTGSALKDAEVDAYQYDGTNWVASAYTLTSSSGAYTFANAVPGSYRFEYYAPGGIYPPIYSGSSATLTGAATTFVPVGTTATVNQKMSVGTGEITGTALVSENDGDPDHLFYDEDRVPVAYPVTAQDISGNATAVDADKAIAGKPASSKGAWSIKNLPAGNYVVEMEINFYGEDNVYLNQNNSGILETIPDYAEKAGLSQASVFTVRSGHTITTGYSTFVINLGDDGASPQFTIDNESSSPIQGAKVVVAPENDPLAYVSGTSGVNGLVPLVDQDGNPITDVGSFDAGDNPLVPGYYTVTVIDPTGAHEPLKETTYLDYGSASHTILLSNLIASPGFSVAPSIPETATAVGTQYSVNATLTREDATPSYQWLRNGTPILGATGETYTSTGADLGDQLSVTVGAVSFGFNTAYATADVGGNDDPTPTTIGDAAVNVLAPTITPSTNPFVGATLQANAGVWNIDGNAATGFTYTYQWSGVGADTTHSTYVVQTGDVGNPITVTVTAHKTGYTDSSSEVSANSVVPQLHPAPIATKAAVVTQKTSHGVTTYTVSKGTWNTSLLNYAYEWDLGSGEVGTGPTITSTDIGSTLPQPGALTAIVTVSKTGYANGTSVANAVKGTGTFTQTAPPSLSQSEGGALSGTGSEVFYIGDKLTVTAPGTWATLDGKSPSSYTYQWYRNGVAISGATSTSYTVTAADSAAGDHEPITVVETAHSAFYPNSPSDPAAVGQVDANNFPNYLQAPTISGAPKDGSTVTAKIGSWGVTSVTNTYKWFDCPAASSCDDPTESGDYLPIANATKSTLALKLAYGYVYVQVTGTKGGYVTKQPISDLTQVQSKTTILNLTSPTVSGTSSSKAPVGKKLTAVVGSWSPSTGTYSYSWQTQECAPGACNADDWTPANGTTTTSSTYTPTATDYGSGDWSIRVEVTSAKTGYTSAVADSPAYAIGLGTMTITKAAKLTITSDAFTITPGTTSPSTPTLSSHWYTDGVNDQNTLVYNRDSEPALGQSVYAEVTYILSGYASPPPTRIIAQIGNAPLTSTPTISGTPTYGNTLSAPTTVSDVFTYPDTSTPDAVLSYKWYSGTTAISGATKSSYKPTSSYIGKHISVKVTATSPLYAPASATSAAVTFASGSFGSPSDPTISSGTVQPGAVLTAVPDTADYGTTPTFTYKWERSTDSGATWTAISGGTHSTYVPVATDVTDELQVIVTATKSHYTTLPLTSDSVIVQYSPTLATLTPPALTGTGQVGGPLTLSIGAWNTPTLTYTYQWFVDDSLVYGVTGTTYTPLASQVGDLVYATVTAHRSGWLPQTVASNLVVVTDADAPVNTVAPTISKVTLESGPQWTVTDSGSWNVDGLTYSYQWFVGSTAQSNAGANTNVWNLQGVSGSGEITVQITATRTGYAPKTITVDTGDSI